MNEFDPPKITLTQPKTKSTSTNVDSVTKTHVRFDKKKFDEKTAINKKCNKKKTDEESAIDPFSRWMHQRVGKTW